MRLTRASSKSSFVQQVSFKIADQGAPIHHDTPFNSCSFLPGNNPVGGSDWVKQKAVPKKRVSPYRKKQ